MNITIRGTLLPTPYDAPIPGGFLRIRNGVIDAMLPPHADPADDPVIDFGDRWILPGLIDTHCHMIFRGDGHWSNGYTEENSRERMLLIAAENGRRALRAGITTLRDLGSPGRLLFELKAAADDGDVELPRLLLAGPPLTPTGGHGWDLEGEVDSPDEIVKLIRALSRDGADVIKVMASGGGTPGTSAGFASFSFEHLQLMADTAHERGLSIVAHATCLDAARDCVTAGFDGLEHAGFWSGEPLVNQYSEEVAAQFAEQHMFIAPTLQASYRTLHELDGQSDAQKARRRQLLSDAFANFTAMLKHDIAWVAGSDAGYMINPFGDLPLGLRLMVENGMTPADALTAATTRSAEALGLNDQIGRLAEGFDADLLVIENSPLADITALRQIHAVYRRGTRIR